MKPTILLTAGDSSNGLIQIRVHQQLQYLRHKYNFVVKDFAEIRHPDIFYSDLIVMSHPFHEDQARFLHRLKRQYNRKVICDLDDLLDNLPADHPEYKTFKGCPIPEFIRLADHVTVSTEFLRLNWGHLNQNMSVIENVIDISRYQGLMDLPKPYKANFTVGWTGSDSHRPDLYNTGWLEGLIQAMETHPEIRFYAHLVCPQILLDKFGSRVIYNERPCDFLDYPAMCATYPMDVCTAPLYDCPFNYAKSDLRLLDLAPFKIPLIASNLGPFAGHGERVLLTENTPKAWFSAIERAYLDRQTLRDKAEKAHDYVLSERGVEKAVEKWDSLLEQILI